MPIRGFVVLTPYFKLTIWDVLEFISYIFQRLNYKQININFNEYPKEILSNLRWIYETYFPCYLSSQIFLNSRQTFLPPLITWNLVLLKFFQICTQTLLPTGKKVFWCFNIQ